MNSLILSSAFNLIWLLNNTAKNDQTKNNYYIYILYVYKFNGYYYKNYLTNNNHYCYVMFKL